MEKDFGPQFEKAVAMLAERRPLCDENSRKPALFHDIRVAIYLYDRNYSSDIILAGLLHDALEWYEINEEALRSEFGDSVTEIVVACTKDDSIKDSAEKIEKIITHCVNAGKDALIVKTADVIDSYKWYTATQNAKELKYCEINADTILRLKSDTIEDPVFRDLRNWFAFK